jgi:hypothetical protein
VANAKPKQNRLRAAKVASCAIAGAVYSDPDKALVMTAIGELIADGHAEWTLLDDGDVELSFNSGETFLLPSGVDRTGRRYDRIAQRRCGGGSARPGTVFFETSWKFVKAVPVGETITATDSEPDANTELGRELTKRERSASSHAIHGLRLLRCSARSAAPRIADANAVARKSADSFHKRLWAYAIRIP